MDRPVTVQLSHNTNHNTHKTGDHLRHRPTITTSDHSSEFIAAELKMTTVEVHDNTTTNMMTYVDSTQAEHKLHAADDQRPHTAL